MRNGSIVHGNETRRIQEVMSDFGVSELASDGSFDLPGGAPVDLGSAEHPARTFGVIFVEVGVDPESGLLRLRRATGVYSAGRIINPLRRDRK
jgi:xanthine dehydrogenase YagR molybdenum-binding subunit